MTPHQTSRDEGDRRRDVIPSCCTSLVGRGKSQDIFRKLAPEKGGFPSGRTLCVQERHLCEQPATELGELLDPGMRMAPCLDQAVQVISAAICFVRGRMKSKHGWVQLFDLSDYVVSL